jgi:Mor family transcriptional regulator
MPGTHEENNELFDDAEQMDTILARLDKLPSDDDAVRKAWPKTLREIMDVLSNELQRKDYSAEISLNLAQCLVARIAHHFGGQMFYFPRDARLKLALRDMDIYNNHNGGNSRELAKRYNLTQQRICKIVQEQHAYARKRHQPELF